MLNYELDSAKKEFELHDAEYHGEVSVVNPFPGLRPFTVDECHLFFGREGQVDEVLVKLAENRFITVLGYSGSGKSSLMYCGIIPILYGGFMTDTGADWNIVVTRPGYSPLDNLAEALIQHDPEYANASEEDRLVKRFIRNGLFEGEPEKDVFGNFSVPLKKVGKLIIPTKEEIALNNRARSAKLRIAEKV